MIEAAGLQAVEGLLHLIEAVGVAIEAGKVKPGARAILTGGDGGAEFLLGQCGIFLFLGDACPHPVRHGRIERDEPFCLGTCFVFAAADDCGGFQVKLGEVGARFPTLGRELDGAFEFRREPFPPGQMACRKPERSAFSP